MLARDASTTVKNACMICNVVLPGQYFDKRPANNRGQTTVFKGLMFPEEYSNLKTVVCPLLFPPADGRGCIAYLYPYYAAFFIITLKSYPNATRMPSKISNDTFAVPMPDSICAILD